MSNALVIKKKSKGRTRLLYGWLMILPILIIRSFTTVYPIIKTFILSFYDISLLRGKNAFCGFQNYLDIFQDEKLLTSIQFTVIFVIVSMVFHVILGIILALVLNMKFRGRRFIRTIVLIPWAMPMVVIGMAAKWAFNDQYGLVNDFVRRFVPNFHFDWLINTGSARAAVIIMDLWKDLPFFAILVLSGLQFISGDIYEAAKVDGASPFQSFFRITLPLITRNVATLCIPFTLWRMTSFDLVYSMTTGGPGQDTALIAYRITMEAFTNLNIGYAAAMAILLFAIMLILSRINLKLTAKIDY
jgi:multiple sugar transport system permease protein